MGNKIRNLEIRWRPRVTGLGLATVLILGLIGFALDSQRSTIPTTMPLATNVAWTHAPSFWQDANADPQTSEDAKASDDHDRNAGEADDPVAEARKSATSVRTVSSNLEELIGKGPFMRPFVLELHGEITFETQKFIQSGIDRARRAKADLVVLEVDSPGGGAAESMEIGDALANITFAPTVAYIKREATSGGALSAYGCQYIVMQEGTTIGDIGVIQFDPVMNQFQYAPAKIRSILVAKVRALCERHGRPADLGEAMVDEYAAVYQNQNDPSLFRLVSMGTPDPADPEKQKAKDGGVAADNLDGGWKLVPESRPGRFLTLTNTRAAELGISQETFPDFQAFEKRVGVKGHWLRRRYGVTDRIVDFLNHFLVTGLLLIVGIIALFMEISAPGISVGGLVALLCFSLFFWSHFAGGTAGWLEVTLFVMGVVFLLAEVFVLPGFGVAGVMGIGLIGSSLIMACLDFLYPQSPQQWNQLTYTMLTISVSGVAGMIGIFVVLHRMGDIPVLRRFTLAPPEFVTATADGKDGKAIGEPAALVVTSGRGAGLKVGDDGVSESVLRPSGRARLKGRSVDVVADGKYIEPGRPVMIVDVRGNRIIVSEILEDSSETPPANS